MKKIIILITVIFSYSTCNSQAVSEISKYNVFAEGGSIYFASSVFVAAERRLLTNVIQKTHLYGRVGAGFVEQRDSINWSPAGMIAITGLIGASGPHFVEITGGLAIGNEVNEPSNETLFFLPVFHFGYRYQMNKKLLFRAKAGLLGIGVGLGYAF